MATVETTRSPFDVIKLSLALVLLLAGIAAYHYYAEQYLTIYRVLALVGVVIVALAIVYQTQFGHSTWQYFQDSRTELRKVVWPTNTEVVQTTLIVAVVVVITGIGLWLMDLLFGWLVQWLLSLSF